jgi:sortase A
LSSKGCYSRFHRMVFFNLDKLQEGDSVIVEDLSGNPYEYKVSEVFAVEPDTEWAIDPVRGRDMLTLQTCTYPDGENRIIVRVDRI